MIRMSSKIFLESQFEEVLKALVERDLYDIKVDRKLRDDFLKSGLLEKSPKKIVEIDTGKVIGIKNVLELICKEIEGKHQFISIEGPSGTGKGSTAEALKQKLKGVKISLGEIFRYLTYLRLKDLEIDFEEVTNGLSYRLNGDCLHLYHGPKNISKELFLELKSPKIEPHIPKVGEKTQKIVIQFVDKELKKLKDSQKKIILEGRSIALDFLPQDVRVKLSAHPEIRAERRLNQKYSKKFPV